MASRREEADLVYQATDKIIGKLTGSLETSKTRADLANIRKSINGPTSQNMNTWGILFENLPVESLGRGPDLNNVEKVVLTTLQLYALHQQGRKTPVQVKQKEEKYDNLGQSLRALRIEGHKIPIDRRFNVMVTSASFEELTYHLRQLIKLLKSRTEVGINYPKLGKDLYYFISGYEEGVRSTWSRAYYYIEKKKEGEENNAK